MWYISRETIDFNILLGSLFRDFVRDLECATGCDTGNSTYFKAIKHDSFACLVNAFVLDWNSRDSSDQNSNVKISMRERSEG